MKKIETQMIVDISLSIFIGYLLTEGGLLTKQLIGWLLPDVACMVSLLVSLFYLDKTLRSFAQCFQNCVIHSLYLCTGTDMPQ